MKSVNKKVLGHNNNNKKRLMRQLVRGGSGEMRAIIPRHKMKQWCLVWNCFTVRSNQSVLYSLISLKTDAHWMSKTSFGVNPRTSLVSDKTKPSLAPTTMTPRWSFSFYFKWTFQMLAAFLKVAINIMLFIIMHRSLFILKQVAL